MTRSASFRYGRALLFFVGAIALFMAAADWMMISHQREVMLDEARDDAENELALIGTIAREALLKRDYITVENFLEQWGRENKSVALAQAVSSNGFILARYHRSSPARIPYYVQRSVRYGGRELVRLKVVKDFAGVERGLDRMSRWLIAMSTIFTVTLSVVLWRTLRALAFRPLEEEIKKREAAEEELKKHRDDLDQIVKSRTAELVGANEKLKGEVELRRRVEMRIAASERELLAILRNMQDTYFRTDSGLFLTRVTPSVKHLLGYSMEDMVGRHIEDIFGGHDANASLAEALAEGGGSVTNLETRLRHKDGSTVWGSTNAQYIYGGNGEVTGVEGTTRDITEIKRTEEAVRLVVEGTASCTGADFFRSLVRNLASSIGVKSAFAAELAGQSSCRARTIAMWMDGIVDNVEYELAGTPCEEVYEGKTSYYPDDVQRLFPADLWLAEIGARSYLGIPFFDSENNVVGHLGVLDDRPMGGRRYVEPIVRLFAARAGAELERKKAEERLERFKTTLDMTLDCVFMFDPDTLRFIYVNQGAVDQVGYSREELLKMTPLDIKPGFTEEGFREMIAPLLNGAAPWSTFETVHLDKNGDGTPVEIFLQYVRPPGESGRFVAIVRDVSERKKTEEALRQTQKLESLGVLAGGIAHDFNNILVGILGNANMALEDLPASSPARECVEDVILSARQAADLARQMLAYSGKGKIVIKPINLTAIIEEMSHLLEVSVSKNVSLTYRLPRSLPSIEGDPSQIRQVVMNLVINASEAIGSGAGEVVVTAGRMEISGGRPVDGAGEGERVFLEVTDNGCGMDAETLGRIFDPFFTTKFTGRGLGLAAVSGIVRGHNGELKVYSEPGRGTTFKALFPAKDVAAEPLSVKTVFSGGHNGSGRVLVVDDELTIRNVARKMLKRAGYTVVTAGDGKEAVDILRDDPHDIDVVLLDMTMPRMDGAKAFQEMRRIRPDLRIILSSGYNEQDAASRFAGKGLAGFIQKPYTNDLLLEKVNEALQAKV